MKATEKDALNLIRHWKDEGAQLRCTFASDGSGFGLTGRVAELSDSVLSVKGTACQALITLDDVSYEYHGALVRRHALGNHQHVVIVRRDARRIGERLTQALAEGVDRCVEGGI